MNVPLLKTKLFRPPQRPFLIPRPHLLPQPLPPLTLIAAPAGYGKTSLISQFLAELTINDLRLTIDQAEPPIENLKSKAYAERSRSIVNSAWFSVDENDNNPARFLAYVVAAVQSIVPDFGAVLLAGLLSSQPPEPETAVSLLLNDLAALTAPLILVLDDYHLIQNDDIHSAVSTLVDYLPPAVHLIITSRHDPPLPLPRWRVRGTLHDIRTDQLRFSTKETAVFFQQIAQHTLSDPIARDLEQRTEGWAAALQIAALSLRGRDNAEAILASFSGTSRHLTDYLLTEVLDQQSPEVRHFLLQTAVLERFNADLCNKLLGQQNSQAILEQLEQANLFLIPLDDERYWYRYHHLFADLLRQQLQREQNDAAIAALHQQAASWFAEEDLLEEAIRHALNSGDKNFAAALIGTIPMHTLWLEGQTSLVDGWMQQLSDETLQQHPKAAVLGAGAHLIVGQFEQARRIIKLIEGQTAVMGEQLFIDAIILRNEQKIKQAVAKFDLALHHLKPDDLMLRSIVQIQQAICLRLDGDLNACNQLLHTIRQENGTNSIGELQTHIVVLQILGWNAFLQNDLYQAQQLFEEGLQLLEKRKRPLPILGVMYTGLGDLFYEWNQLDKAEELYEKATYWGQRTGIADIVLSATTGLLDLAAARGDKATARQQLQKLHAATSVTQITQLRQSVTLLAAHYWLRLGDPNQAVLLMEQANLSVDDPLPAENYGSYQTLAELMLTSAIDRQDHAGVVKLKPLLTRLIDLCQTQHNQRGLARTLLIQAQVEQFLGNHQKAVNLIQKTVTLTQKGRLIRFYLDHLPSPQPLLQIAQASSYQAQLLSAFEQQQKASPLPDPLTEREMDVLRHIAAGLSNKEIEAQLFISKNTVRSHIKNLYSKLSVSSRTQAIQRARTLRLIND